MNNTLMIFLICAINLGISWWNTYAVGRMWTESKQQGGFLRLLVWCAATQSAIGFSSVIMLVELAGLPVIMPIINLLLVASDHHAITLSPELTNRVWNGVMSLWYLAIIVPALGTGLVLTLESWRAAIQRRDAASIGTAAWNTFAQASNTYNAFSDVGEAWQGASSVFSSSGDKEDDNVVTAIILFLVGVALVGGIMLTYWLVNYYASNAEPIRKGFGRRAAAR